MAARDASAEKRRGNMSRSFVRSAVRTVPVRRQKRSARRTLQLSSDSVRHLRAGALELLQQLSAGRLAVEPLADAVDLVVGELGVALLDLGVGRASLGA